jgi:hypothetical protein
MAISPYGIDPKMMQFQLGPTSANQPFSFGQQYGSFGTTGSIGFNPSNPGAAPIGQSSQLDSYLSTIRQNMAYQADPNARIRNAQQGNYYADPSQAGANLTNYDRQQRLEMAYAGNPMARINPQAAAQPTQGSGSNNMTDVLAALARSITSSQAAGATTYQPQVTVTPTSASTTSTTNPNIGMK